MQSDHQDYFVDILMEGLYDHRLPYVVNPAERSICNSHPRLVRKYIEKLSDYFEDHGSVKKAQKAQHYFKYEAVEKLDELITAGMLHAECECKNDVSLPWSREIHGIMTQVHILHIQLSNGLQNRIDYKVQMKEKQKSLKVK